MNETLRRVARGLPHGLDQSDFKEMWQEYLAYNRPKLIVTLIAVPRKHKEEKPPRTRREAIDRWKHEKTLKGIHTGGGLLGFFYLRYKTWCQADYRRGLVTTNYTAMEALVQREGARRAEQAIVELFDGEGLNWVTNKELDFLCDPEKWSRFVAPALVERKSKGGRVESKHEQSDTYSTRRRT